jgi:hypothetical protein
MREQPIGQVPDCQLDITQNGLLWDVAMSNKTLNCAVLEVGQSQFCLISYGQVKNKDLVDELVYNNLKGSRVEELLN